MLNNLSKEDFDSVIRSGKDLIIFFYKEKDAKCTIGRLSLEEVAQMIGRSFSIYIVDADINPEIRDACSVHSVPEIISIKNTKIFKRRSGVLKSNEILDLLK